MKQGIDYVGVSVGALILNDNGEVFLSKRSQNAKNERGCWEAPGGAVHFGEKLEDANLPKPISVITQHDIKHFKK